MTARYMIFFHPDFEPEYQKFPETVKDELMATIRFIADYGGPRVGRPQVDTLVGSKYANLKEMRFEAAGGVWRAAFAFDPERKAIVLVARDKSGVSSAGFYKTLIRIADRRLKDHLDGLKATGV